MQRIYSFGPWLLVIKPSMLQGRSGGEAGELPATTHRLEVITPAGLVHRGASVAVDKHSFAELALHTQPC